MWKDKYFIRTYKYEFLTAIFTIASYTLSFIYSKNSKTLLILSIIITFTSLIFIIYFRLKDKDFFFTPLTKSEDRDNWIGKGIFEYKRSNNSYLSSESEPGFIFSKCFLWSDYTYEFDFKIANKCIGAIVRAVDLSNYLMFQINESGIRPHLRINGGWRFWEHAEAGLSFENNLSKDKWYKCRISCEKELINIQIIQDNKGIFNRSWSIPNGRVVFEFPQDDKETVKTKITFPVDLDYGTVGIRNSHDEKAFVRNVYVEKL